MRVAAKLTALYSLLVSTLMPLSSAEYRTVLTEVALLRPISLVTDVLSECECRAKCLVQSKCVAASYYAVADTCAMTESEPESVITQPLVNSVAFFKKQYTQADPGVFTTAEKSRNGTKEKLREMCADEDGVPLIITTQNMKSVAIDLAKKYGGQPWFNPRFAWLPARYCEESDLSECRWPDGTLVTDGVFTENEFDSFGGVALPYSTLLGEHGKIRSEKEYADTYYPVLCSRSFR